MPRIPHVWAALASAVSIGWAVRLVSADDPLAAAPAMLLGADVILLAVVAVAGYVLAHSRWAYLLAMGVVGFELAMLALIDRDFWAAALAAGCLAILGLGLSPPARHWVRDRPARRGPPPRVVVLVVGLLVMPALVALAAPSGPGLWHWLLVAVALLGGWGYTRALVPALWLLRTTFPAAGLLAAITSPWPGGAALAAATAGLTALAWLRDASLSAAPLAPPRVVTYRIPPELAPAEVLEQAGLDEAGRPRRR